MWPRYMSCPHPRSSTAEAASDPSPARWDGAASWCGVKDDASRCFPTRPGTRRDSVRPVDGVAHAYVATSSFAALLESAIHETAPPTPVIYSTQLAEWIESAVKLTTDVRLFDLDDTELDRLGIDRADLVATDPLHYSCTRAWAATRVGRQVGQHETHGLIWRSRQTELHASALAHRPALAELVDEHPADVAVLWSPPAAASVLANQPGDASHSSGQSAELVLDHDDVGRRNIVSRSGHGRRCRRIVRSRRRVTGLKWRVARVLRAHRT